MIERLEELRARVYGGASGSLTMIITGLIDVIEEEIRHRLEFEDAVLRYLERSPSNPFAASAELAAFIRADEESEEESLEDFHLDSDRRVPTRSGPIHSRPD